MTSAPSASRTSFLARALPLAVVGMASAHALAAVLAAITGADPAPYAWVLTLSGLSAGLLAARLSRGRLDRWVPAWLEEEADAHPVRTRAWAVFAVVAIVQVARLSTWITDPDSSWFLTTQNAFWADHECLPAYIHGAELALRGEPNVYDVHHYPGLDPEARPQTALHGMVVEDPYQYPPPFLLAPAAAVTLTHHYPAIRAVWFAAQATFLVLFATWLAVWVGGPLGRAAYFGLPLFLSAFPTLHALQYGQLHLSAVLLAVSGMTLLHVRRDAAGGALLAIAVVTKVFPGVLLLPLLAQRRFGALAWVALSSLGLAAAAVAVFGLDPFVAFATYQLPRLASGKAFAFGEAWPELAPLVIADNQGIFGLVEKLHAMGATALTGSVAAAVNRGYAVLLVVVALLVGTRLKGADRAERVTTWIGLLGLASLMSTGAFGDYVPLTAVWLGTFLLAHLGEARTRRWLVPSLVLAYTLLGTTPIGSWFDPALLVPVSAVGVLALLAVFASPVARCFARASAASAEPSSGPERALSASRW